MDPNLGPKLEPYCGPYWDPYCGLYSDPNLGPFWALYGPKYGPFLGPGPKKQKSKKVFAPGHGLAQSKVFNKDSVGLCKDAVTRDRYYMLATSVSGAVHTDS